MLFGCGLGILLIVRRRLKFRRRGAETPELHLLNFTLDFANLVGQYLVLLFPIVDETTRNCLRGYSTRLMSLFLSGRLLFPLKLLWWNRNEFFWLTVLTLFRGT